MSWDEQNNRKNLTMEEVAQRAGVSTATVSRCLNSPDRVAEKTRIRVMEIIRSVGYSPDFGASVMAAKRTNTIGAVIPTMENAVFANGLQAFQEELRRHLVTLLLASSSYKFDLEEEQVRTLVSRGADGILLIGHHRNNEVYRFLAQQNVPALVAWSYDTTAELPSVGFDNCEAMRTLASAVIREGHRTIGVITAMLKTNDRAQARVDGIRLAMKDAGLPESNLQIVETEYGIDEGAAAFSRLMTQPDCPTVVMCGNDVLAVGAINRANQMGLKVPDDVSVTGFDDLELAKITSPPLTTVHVPHRRMGAEAARTLVRMVREKGYRNSICLDTAVRWRGSLGPPNRSHLHFERIIRSGFDRSP